MLIDTNDIVLDFRSSGYVVSFSDPPPLGVRVMMRADRVAELIEVETYAKQNGETGFILCWEFGDGSSCTTGLRAKGVSKDLKRKDREANRNRISCKVRFQVLERDGFRCTYCGKGPDEERFEVDHIVPVSHGGGNDLGNLRVACRTCNVGKSNTITKQAVEMMF